MITLTREAIDHERLVDEVRSRQAGAVVLFLGTVREMTGDRQTVALEYEAFPEMARAKLAELLEEAKARWPVTRSAVVHRLGRLNPGDVSVAVAVSTPHRREAFEAAEYIMNRLKAIVPIWKQENYSDGLVEWVHPGTDGHANA
jgi:molybdopterin synthase catalytic subunit